MAGECVPFLHCVVLCDVLCDVLYVSWGCGAAGVNMCVQWGQSLFRRSQAVATLTEDTYCEDTHEGSREDSYKDSYENTP